MFPLLLFLTLAACSHSLGTKQALNCSKLERLKPLMTIGERLQDRGDKFDEFDWALSKTLNSAERGNIVISPISLKVVLAMLYEGARGKTAREIGDALNLANTAPRHRTRTRQRFTSILHSLQTSKGEYKIKMGTHVFIDNNAEINETYQCKLREYYNSDMEKVDFSDTAAAVKTINNWASNATEGHIQELVSEAEAQASTIMLLLNAVYFKGLWKIPFPENQTKSGTFHLSENEGVKVPLMNITDRFSYYNVTDLNAQIIELPYLGDKFAMYILLPNSNTGLDNLAQALGPEKSLAPYLRNMSSTIVNLIMPKFEFDFTTSLRPSLEKLNIKTMFTTEAELTDIAVTLSGSLVVTNVLQKAGISVTEIGTVAYAATVVDLMDKFGAEEEKVEFKADHPFIFFIEEKTLKTTVFVGKVVNPGMAKVEPVTEKTPPLSSSTQSDTSTIQPIPERGEAQTTDSSNCAGTLCKELEERFPKDQEASQARFNFFDADLLKEIGNKENGNFVISPASIKTLLALIIEAAEGSTLTELQTVLRLPENMTMAHTALSGLHTALQKAKDSKVTVDSINQAFISKNLSPNTTYTKTIKNYYKADVSLEDFSSPETASNNINNWIRAHTRGLITSLINPDMIDSETQSVLTSAIYFDGKWKTEFLPHHTREMCFYTDDKICQNVPMMSKKEELYYKFDVALDSHVLQIPYEDEKFSMVIVLPRKMDGMRQLNFDAARLSFPTLLQKLEAYEVHLKMPSFNIEYGTELTTILRKMGLSEVFSEHAKLPYMINNIKGKVGAVVHKAKIEVSEKGTKAAAASGASVVPLMYGLEGIKLEVNHPFYYFVCEHETQTVLFAGRLSSIEQSATSQVLSEVEPLNTETKPNNHGAHNHPYIQSTGRYPPEHSISFPFPIGSTISPQYMEYLQKSKKKHVRH